MATELTIFDAKYPPNLKCHLRVSCYTTKTKLVVLTPGVYHAGFTLGFEQAKATNLSDFSCVDACGLSSTSSKTFVLISNVLFQCSSCFVEHVLSFRHSIESQLEDAQLVSFTVKLRKALPNTITLVGQEAKRKLGYISINGAGAVEVYTVFSNCNRFVCTILKKLPSFFVRACAECRS